MGTIADRKDTDNFLIYKTFFNRFINKPEKFFSYICKCINTLCMKPSPTKKNWVRYVLQWGVLAVGVSEKAKIAFKEPGTVKPYNK